MKFTRKMLLLLDNCTAHHVGAHLSAVEVLFLPPNATVKVESMDQRVILESPLSPPCHRHPTVDNLADVKVPLVKAIFFVSRDWRSVKSRTILHCFQKAGFSRGSSAAEEETAAADAAAVTSLKQLWEVAGNASLVPSGMEYMDIALRDEDLVATEELTTDKLATSVSEKEAIADGSSSNPEGVDMAAAQPVASGVALAAVDALRIYSSSELDDCTLMNSVEARVLNCVLSKCV
ncbi:hypothetical protein HPB51_026847 [Rhipicephalus microplus]|uniref:DDE-1 domain-containing protein n=1 Tax=Rhipicephalus microplus TaxID=6941 RepID=A0A9J6D1Z7_RHIMP|nr:hypothetical protein HPB51_026847 [Rhipicephalus microplus]